MSGLKTIALVDFQMEGHHGGWLVHIAETLLRLGHRVVCLCPDPARMVREIHARSPGFATAFSSLELQNVVFPRLPTLRLREFVETVGRWRRVAAVIATGMPRPPDLVCFAMLDGLLALGVTPAVVERCFPHRWTGIYFHPRAERFHHARAERPALLRPDSCLRSEDCAAVAILDEGIADRIARFVSPKEVVVLPDFSIPAAPAGDKPAWIAEIRRRAGNRTVVGCIGLLSRRKGIFTLLRTAMQAEASEFFFVFAGLFFNQGATSEERSLWEKAVAHPPENCILQPETIPSDAAFDELIQRCDLLFAAYHRFPHSSNLLVKAAQFHKPIVVSKGYCMAERVERFALGIAVPENDPAATLTALRTLRAGLAGPGDPSAGGFDSYMAEHSTARLEKGLRQLVCH